MPKYSSKYLNLSALSNVITALNSPSSDESIGTNDVWAIILTPLGTIEARISDIPVDSPVTLQDDGRARFELSYIAEQKRKMIDLLGVMKKEKVELIGDGSTITLEDATLTPTANPNNTQFFKSLVLFSDQIIGYTLNNKV